MDAYENPQLLCSLLVKGRKSGENKEQEFRHVTSLLQNYTHRWTGFKNLHQLLVLDIQKCLCDKKIWKEWKEH